LLQSNQDPQQVITQRLAGSASAGFAPQSAPGQPVYLQTLTPSSQPLYANLPVRRAVHFGHAGGHQSPFSPAQPPINSPLGAHQMRTNALIRPNGPGMAPEIVLQNDFRRVSGLTSDVFRQLETVERMFDTIGVPADALQRPGEMLVRVLDPRLLGPAGAEAGAKYLAEGAARPALGPQCVQFVEILKRPGQTLGLYIREGDGSHCIDGVFVSRIAIDSPVRHSGLLKVGDEILAVNLVDVGHMSLDDVVLLMSIPRRLLLTTRSSLSPIVSMNSWRNTERASEPSSRQPVVILKSGMDTNLDESRRTELGPVQRRLLDGVASLVGGASSIEVTGDEIVVDGHLVVYEDPYGRIGLRPREESGWSNAAAGLLPVTSSVGALPIIVNQQPLSYDSSGRLQLTRAHIHRPPSALAGSMLSRSGSLSAAGPLGSALALHHPSLFSNRPLMPSRLNELSSATRLGLQPTLSDYFLDRLQRPASRLSQLSVAAAAAGNSRRRYLGNNAQGQLPHSMSSQGLATMIRRRASVHGPPAGRSRSRAALTSYDASCSDSELAWAQLPVRPASALGVPRPYPSLPMNTYESGRASSMSLRCQSLPRSRQAPLPDFRYNSNTNYGKQNRLLDYS
jgi:hypothetical protein